MFAPPAFFLDPVLRKAGKLHVLPTPCEELLLALSSISNVFPKPWAVGGERNKVHGTYHAWQPVTISSLIFLQLRELKWGPSFDQPQHGPTFRDGPKGLTLAAEHRSEHNRQQFTQQLDKTR